MGAVEGLYPSESRCHQDRCVTKFGGVSYVPKYKHFTFTNNHYKLMQAWLDTLSVSMAVFWCDYQSLRENIGVIKSEV